MEDVRDVLGLLVLTGVCMLCFGCMLGISVERGHWTDLLNTGIQVGAFQYETVVYDITPRK